MKATLPETPGFEFYFPERDTLVLVEATPETIVIHATRDTFSEQRKCAFIRELAAEGFIADSYGWQGPGTFSRVRWLVDISWLELSETARITARNFARRLLVSGAVLWVCLLTALMQGWLAPQQYFVATNPPATLSSAGPRALHFNR